MADSDIMARMAASVMGGGAGRPESPAAKPPTLPPTAPRTIPAPSFRAATNAPTFQPQTHFTKNPKVVITSPPATVAPSLTTMNLPPAVTRRDMNTDMGPSLRGDPAQLKLARQFMDELSGGKKGSYGRPPPSRHDSMSSTNSSVRSTRTRDIPSPNPGFNYLAGRDPPPPGRDNTLSGWQGFSSGPSNKTKTPAISVAQPKTPLAPPPAPAIVAKPQAPPTTAPSVKAFGPPVQQAVRVQIPATPVKHHNSAGLLNRQMATVTNTFTSNANNPVPPHLRRKADQAVPKAATETTSTGIISKDVMSPTTQPTAIKDEKKEVAAFAPKVDAATTSNVLVEVKKKIKAEPKANQGPTDTPFTFSTSTEATSLLASAVNGTGTKTSPIDLDTPPPPLPPSSVTATSTVGQDDAKKLVWIIAELNELKTQVKELENENLELNQKAERLQESEGRRKFLGTDDARVPFTVSITNPHGQSHTFQASKEKKVKQLILDARFKFKLDKDSCKRPTLSFHGKQVGHAMMVGELGAGQGSTFAFSYESVDEEEL